MDFSTYRPCQYADSLGSPGTGFHQSRLNLPFTTKTIALWDTVGTIVIVIILILAFGLSPIKVILITGILTVALHWLFCVPTAGNKMIGL